MERLIDDVFACRLPDGMDPTAPDLATLHELALKLTWLQYDARPERPADIRMTDIEVLVSQDLDEIEEFQPSGHCRECREGNERIRARLAEHPDQWMLVCNTRYVEVWP